MKVPLNSTLQSYQIDRGRQYRAGTTCPETQGVFLADLFIYGHLLILLHLPENCITRAVRLDVLAERLLWHFHQQHWNIAGFLTSQFSDPFRLEGLCHPLFFLSSTKKKSRCQLLRYMYKVIHNFYRLGQPMNNSIRPLPSATEQVIRIIICSHLPCDLRVHRADWPIYDSLRGGIGGRFLVESGSSPYS